MYCYKVDVKLTCCGMLQMKSFNVDQLLLVLFGFQLHQQILYWAIIWSKPYQKSQTSVPKPKSDIQLAYLVMIFSQMQIPFHLHLHWPCLLNSMSGLDRCLYGHICLLSLLQDLFSSGCTASDTLNDSDTDKCEWIGLFLNLCNQVLSNLVTIIKQ